MLGINLYSVYPANNAYIYVHYCTNLKLPDVYVGIVGCIYRIKIDPFLFPYFFEQWSSLHLFFFSFIVHSSMCMQGQMEEK